MAIAVYFHPRGMTLTDFEESHRRLDDAGAGNPSGRIHHSCFGDDGDLMVYDIWESPEQFEAFGQILMPILAKIGIDAREPAIMALHRLNQVGVGQSTA
ncbi:MAG: hypothetical protein M3319_08420 [Actinomycetota bacterium]|nr:hypothetical protein [Actinomycetota bacterium]MDQ3900451.1 hypothetical protein [Actinomycetota bacterium]